jgi:RHS repeat-associated protein
MHHYAYDAESRLTSVDNGVTATYIYDYAGNRVRKTANGLSLDYIYDLNGHAVTEVSVPASGAGVWNRAEIYADGTHLATYTGGTSGTMYFNHSDWLGTERVRTSLTLAIAETCTSLPFGDNLSCTGTDTSPLHFTGKQRDGESGLDNFGARYLGTGVGRFISPDEPFYSGDLDPQSLNLYSYVLNNPLKNIDPGGHDVELCLVGAPKCVYLTDPDYKKLYNAQNGANGINLPGGTFPNGDVTCSGQTCGTAEYFEPPADGITPNVTIVGTVAGARGIGPLFNLLRTAADVLDGLFPNKSGIPGASGGKATFQDLLQGLVRDGGSRSEIYTKSGGNAQAEKDFDALGGTAQNLGRVKVKDLPNGEGRAVLRAFSSGGKPTLELQPAGGGYKGIAIRYNP